MNQPTDGRKVAIALPSHFTNPFIKAMHDSGLLPVNCSRFVIDSGEPDGVMKIYSDCFVDDRIMDDRIIKSISELQGYKDEMEQKHQADMERRASER